MDTQAEVDAALDARAATERQAADARIAVSASLSETPWFRLAAGVLEVGDRVPLTIDVGPPDSPVTITTTQTITEATISWTTDRGLTVTPKLGAGIDDPQGPLLQRVAALSQRLRALAPRR